MDKKKKDYEYGTLEYAEGIGKEYADMNYDTFKQGEEYSGLKKSYEERGQKAMKDTIAQMAARTGGMASSYAQTAGQQAYGDWMSRLEDAAYEMYGAQKADKLTEYNLAQDAYKNRKAVADEEELKANELKTQNENKLWMKFALGELTPGTMSEADYASYGLTPEEAQTVYDDWLYQSTDKRKAEEEKQYTTALSDFEKDLNLGLIEAEKDATTADIAAQYGITEKDAQRIVKAYDILKASANEEEIYQMSNEEISDAMETLFDPTIGISYKEEYLNWLKLNGYITDKMRSDILATIKSEKA